MNLNYIYNSSTKLLSSIQGKNERTNEDYGYTYLYDSQKRPYITRETNGKAFFEHQVSRDSYGRISNEIYITTNHSDNVNSTVKVKNIYDSNSGVLTEIKDFNSNTSLWKINEVNQRGQALKVTLGNGVSKNRTYDQYGFLTKIYDRASSVVLDLDYSFNTVRGNLNSRKNNNLGWNESFTYDHLDRLTNISGSVSRSQQYDGRGRITSNSEIGTYNYESNNLYRLKGVDLNTKGDLHYQNQPIQKIKYNSYKKPVSISIKDKAKVDFEYGILQNRSHAYYGGNEDNKLDRRYQKHYSGITPVEIEVDKQGNTKIITYIGGDAYSAPVVHIKQTASGSANGYHYLHRDYLSSILAISDSSGTVKEQRQFGAWGGVDKFKKANSEIDFENSTTLLNRGYTGHEHFMSVALIHMNGRMYDAKLGRFLSPDNYIQEPFSTQSFNRYGYVWNNPLKYTDQSGEFFWIAFAIGAFIGGTSAAIQGGNFGDILLGALIGGVAAGVGVGVGNLLAGGTSFFSTAALSNVTGFINGALVGAGSGFASGFTGGFLGSLASGRNFGDALVMGALAGTSGLILGAAIGGVTAGIKAINNGRDFWYGNVKNPPQPIRLTPVGIKLNPKVELTTEIIDAKPTLNEISETNWSSSPVGDDARISSGFGVDRNIGSSPHKGVDYAVPVGTEVRSTADGIVSRAYSSRSYGNTVIINHGISPNGGGNVYTLYAHGNNLNVSAGQSVRLGDLIFNSGATGSAASGAHLHYEVIRTLFSPNSPSFFSGFNLRHLPGSLGGLLGF